MNSFKVIAVIVTMLCMGAIIYKVSAGEPVIQKGPPPAVVAHSTVPEGAIGGLILSQCTKVVAIQYVILKDGQPGLLTLSAAEADPTFFAQALEEATFMLKAGAPVRKLELNHKCQIT